MYEVVWPRGNRMVGVIKLADRFDTLEGKTVCSLWDWRFAGDQVFPMIENELAKRYPRAKFVGYEVFGSTHGAQEAKMLANLPDMLKQYRCDAVISGIGC